MSRLDTIAIKNEKLDRRAKLTAEERLTIKELYPEKSQRVLAREFGVSRRLIQFIVDPEKHKGNLETRKANGGWKTYYDKEKHRQYMAKHRAHKRELLREGLIG